VTACKVAVVGAGEIAREHVRAFRDVPSVQVAGIHSRTRARAESLADQFSIPTVCDSIGELYEKTEADLVAVTVPPLAMNSVSRACFQHPWTVLLEKPPGYNMADAIEIRTAAAGHRVLVAFNRRFLSSTRAALAGLAEQDGPRFIHVQDQEDRREAGSLGHPAAVVENWMYANSIHVIDYLRLFGRGDIVSVSPVVEWDPDKSPYVVAKVEFDSGDIGLYQGIWDGPGSWAVSVSTSQMRWEMRPLEQAAYQARGDRQMHPVEMHPWDRQFKPGFRLQAQMAVAAALGESSDSPTLAEAMETMTLIAVIFRQ
jgi:predicted dehydrogenase